MLPSDFPENSGKLRPCALFAKQRTATNEAHNNPQDPPSQPSAVMAYITKLDRISPESRELYQEWTEIPPPEILERQKDGVETLIPDPSPNKLMPPATVGAY